MNSLVTVRFDDRDSADLALMRLRRRGVHFDFVGLLHSDGERRGPAEVFSPYSSSMTNMLGSDDPLFPNIGSIALFSAHGEVPKRDVMLKIRVENTDLPRARDILRSANGRRISAI